MPESPPNVPDQSAVEEWLAGLRQQLHDIEGKIEPLLAEQSQLRQRETLLLSLLRSFQPGSSAEIDLEQAPSTIAPTVPGESVGEYVRAGVRAILVEAGAPLHINEIHSRFIGKGLVVPGAQKPANLTAHLTGFEGIVSPRRGVYVLAAVGERSKPMRTKKRRRRKRRMAR